MKLLSKNKLWDMTFIVGSKHKTDFKVNRLLMASISPVFEAMLYGRMNTTESKDNTEISLELINPETFEQVIKFAYCNKPKFTQDNIMEIAQICDLYQIQSLYKCCINYFRSCLTRDNLCKLLQESVDGGHERFIKECIGFLRTNRSNHKAILFSKSFLQMKHPAMTTLLDCDDLNVEETEIWDAVLRWSIVHSRAFAASQVKQLEMADFDEKMSQCSMSTVNIKPIITDFHHHMTGDDAGDMIASFRKISFSGEEFRDKQGRRKKIRIPLHPSNNYQPTILQIGLEQIDLKDIMHVAVWRVRNEEGKGALRVLHIVYRNTERHLWASTPEQADRWCKGLRHLIKESEEAAAIWWKLEDYRVEMLKSIKKSIRFGLMNGEYIAKNVKDWNILTSEELVAIFVYQYDHNKGCAGFNTKKRCQRTSTSSSRKSYKKSTNSTFGR